MPSPLDGENIILNMENVVPAPAGQATLAARSVARSLADRYETYADEVRRLIDAGIAVMRRTGSIDPRVGDIVREAGLSNQAFYRHFTSKDELLLAMLDDGRHRLVEYLEHRMRDAPHGVGQVRCWIEGVMEQARNEEAARNTRVFAINGARLAHELPDETAHSRELLLLPLREAVRDAAGDPARDADAIYHLVMGRMQAHLVERTVPSKADVEHLVRFALAGLGAAEATETSPRARP